MNWWDILTIVVVYLILGLGAYNIFKLYIHAAERVIAGNRVATITSVIIFWPIVLVLFAILPFLEGE
jgi:hypothetical protein